MSVKFGKGSGGIRAGTLSRQNLPAWRLSWRPCWWISAMPGTKENGRLRGRLLFCVLEPSVRPKRELLNHVTQALTSRS
jgi:hypothetical protein